MNDKEKTSQGRKAEMKKETGILFKPDMHLAIREDRKTQTRRTRGLKRINQEPDAWRFNRISYDRICDDGKYAFIKRYGEYDRVVHIKCPFGKNGDLLYIKEAHKYWDWDECGNPFIKYKLDGDVRFFDSTIPDDWAGKIDDIWAELSERNNYKIDGYARDRKWRSPLFMPKWMARDWLELTEDPMPQRVQDINEEECLAEGINEEEYFICCDHASSIGCGTGYIAKNMLAELWDSIHGTGAWDRNNWVWRLKFRRVEK